MSCRLTFPNQPLPKGFSVYKKTSIHLIDHKQTVFDTPVVYEATWSNSTGIVRVRGSEHVLYFHQSKQPLSVHSRPTE